MNSPGIKQLFVDRCPHCGIAKPNLQAVWQGVVEGTDRSWGQTMWGCFACATCGQITTARGYFRTPLDPHDPQAIFPAIRSAHADLPEQARRYLDQAYQTLSAPDAAAMVAGSAVDAMLKHLGYQDGSVYSRIDKAQADGHLTIDMAKWAHSVRLGANRPRHADADAPHVSPHEAKQSVEFAEALGNFLFVLTARIKRGLEEAASAATA